MRASKDAFEPEPEPEPILHHFSVTRTTAEEWTNIRTIPTCAKTYVSSQHGIDANTVRIGISLYDRVEWVCLPCANADIWLELARSVADMEGMDTLDAETRTSIENAIRAQRHEEQEVSNLSLITINSSNIHLYTPDSWLMYLGNRCPSAWCSWNAPH